MQPRALKIVTIMVGALSQLREAEYGRCVRCGRGVSMAPEAFVLLGCLLECLPWLSLSSSLYDAPWICLSLSQSSIGGAMRQVPNTL